MDSSAGSRLRARTRIGSSGTAVHYASSDRAFHPTDVPAKARQARIDMRKPSTETQWDATCTFNRGRQILNHTLSHHAAREFTYNFRAETLPPLRPISKDVFGRLQKVDLSAGPIRRVQEMPTHPALESKTPWSATPLTLSQRASSLSNLTAASLLHTSTVRRSLLAGKPQSSLVERERAFTAHLRAVREGTGASTLGASFLLGPASGSSSGSVGADSALGAIPLDALQPRKPLAGQSRLARKYGHDGSYGVAVGSADAAGASGDSFWSCCGASERDSKGCRMTVHNPDRYVFDSPFGR